MSSLMSLQQYRDNCRTQLEQVRKQANGRVKQYRPVRIFIRSNESVQHILDELLFIHQTRPGHPKHPNQRIANTLFGEDTKDRVNTLMDWKVQYFEGAGESISFQCHN